jgi:hypothetical protein
MEQKTNLKSVIRGPLKVIQKRFQWPLVLALFSLIIFSKSFGQQAGNSTTSSTAQVNSSSQSLGELKTKVEGGDDAAKVDDEITNARMRADLGGAKKWSFNSSLSYSGSTLADPTNSLRPNIIAGATNFDDATSLNGGIGMTYRKDKNNAFGLSAAVVVYTPFAGDWTRTQIDNPTNPGRNVDRINFSNPSVSYTHSRKLGEMQYVARFSLTSFTEPVFLKQSGMLGSFGLSQTLAMQADRWTLGSYVNASIPLYQPNLTDAQSQKESLMTLGLIPFMEYQFTEKIGWRAVFNYFAWQYRKNASKAGQAAFSFNTPQNSTGVMFSVSRDVWIYPNFQFLPFNMRSDLTNWGVSTIINL